MMWPRSNRARSHRVLKPSKSTLIPEYNGAGALLISCSQADFKEADIEKLWLLIQNAIKMGSINNCCMNFSLNGKDFSYSKTKDEKYKVD